MSDTKLVQISAETLETLKAAAWLWTMEPGAYFVNQIRAACFAAMDALTPAEPPAPDIGTGEFVADGFGCAWEKCSRPDCGLQVVRPGKAQCAHDCHVPIRETGTAAKEEEPAVKPQPAPVGGEDIEFHVERLAYMIDNRILLGDVAESVGALLAAVRAQTASAKPQAKVPVAAIRIAANHLTGLLSKSACSAQVEIDRWLARMKG